MVRNVWACSLWHRNIDRYIFVLRIKVGRMQIVQVRSSELQFRLYAYAGVVC